MHYVNFRFNDFVEYSKDLESELESYVTSEQKKSEDLNRKLTMAETRIADLMEQLLDSRKLHVSLETELQSLKSKLAATVAAKCTLELAQDDLLNKVRVLEATEDELCRKNESANETIVFLESDIESLREHVKDLEAGNNDSKLERDMYRKQCEDLRSELLKCNAEKSVNHENEVYSPISPVPATSSQTDSNNNNSNNNNSKAIKSESKACCIIQ